MRVGSAAFKRSHENGGIGDVFRHWAGGVMVGGQRNDPVTADAADGRPKPNQHVLVRWADDRSPRVAADVRCPEIRSRSDSRTGSSWRQHRPAVKVRLARTGARVVGVVSETTDSV